MYICRCVLILAPLIFGQMSKLLKAGIHIFSLFAALTVVSGCWDDYPEAPPVVKLISVSGIVTDIADGEPVTGVTVTMTAYSLDDTDKLSPLYSDSYDTASDGSYWFMRSDETSSTLTGVYYEFTLSDNYEERADHYKPAQRSLFLLASSPFYNSVTKVYKVESNNFLVSK